MGGKQAKIWLVVFAFAVASSARAGDHDFEAPETPSPSALSGRGIGVKKTSSPGRGAVSSPDLSALSAAFAGGQGGTSNGNPLAALGGALGAAGFPSGPSDSAASDFLDKFKSGMGNGEDTAAPPKASGPEIDPEALANDTSGVLRLKALGQQSVNLINNSSAIRAETVFTKARAIQGAAANGGQRAGELAAYRAAEPKNQLTGTVQAEIPFVNVRTVTPGVKIVTKPSTTRPQISPQMPQSLVAP